MDITHVTPTNDLLPHTTEDLFCACGPRQSCAVSEVNNAPEYYTRR